MVRTKAFKDWFGDWENDPENASKVVDSNGEPLVVYRGDSSKTNIFKGNTFFSSNDYVAGSYSNEDAIPEYNVFLNIKNPLNLLGGNELRRTPNSARISGSDPNVVNIFKKAILNLPNDYTVSVGWGDKWDKKTLYELVINNYEGIEYINHNTQSASWEAIIKYAKTKGFDGVFMNDESVDKLIQGQFSQITFHPNQIKLADGTNTTFDPNNDDIRFKTGGTVLLAPNGNPSNLTTEQYELVRTPEFKRWFGDWENDPENASKVVDENGEPLVCFHGTNSNFTVFKTKKRLDSINNPLYESGLWFFAPSFDKQITEDERNYSYEKGNAEYMAETFMGNKDDKGNYIENKVIKVFLNVRNPKIIDGVTDRQAEELKYYSQEMRKLKNNDAIIMHGSLTDGNMFRDDINVLNANQIKLADGTNTTFDQNSDDIRFATGGTVLLAPNGKPSNLTTEQYKLVRTPEFKAWFGDWENDPKNASKVVDENGEPKVVWRGESKEFNKFDYKKLGSQLKTAWRKAGFYFSPTKVGAEQYMIFMRSDILKQFFLNIKNPNTLDSNEFYDVMDWGSLPKQRFKTNKSATDYANSQVEKMKIDNYDGFFVTDLETEDVYEIVAFNPNQIKLADGTNTTFDPNSDDIRYRRGGRTTAQTPAPSKERIYGSDRNKPRSSKDGSSAESIKYDNKTLTSIENKVEEHNEAYPDKKVNLATAKAVVRRGMGAYSKSHRPTISGGKPNSRVAWGLARLNAFLYKVVNGVSKSGKYSQDNDLLDELGIVHKKFAEGGNTEEDKIIKAKQLLRNSIDYLEDDLELLGKGLNGMAFVTVIDGELYVAKYTKSLTEFWLSQMAMVSNPPHVVTIKDVKKLSDNFEYGIIHKYTDNGGVPNKAVWNVAIGIKFKEYLEAQKSVPPKEKEYVRNLAIKLSSEVQDYFGGITIDTSNDNWGYEDGKLVLFDIDGNVKKAHYEEWMQKHASSKFKKGGKIPKKSKGGDCYVVSGRIALNNRLPNVKTREFVGEPYVIHAQVTGQGAIAGLKYGHAWVEDDEYVYDYSNGRELKIPKEVYYRLGQVIEQQPIYFKYTFGEAKRKMAETGHFGSWDLITESGL